jgi:hypothetical protein
MLYFVPEGSVLGEKAVIEALCGIIVMCEEAAISDEFNFEDVG